MRKGPQPPAGKGRSPDARSGKEMAGHEPSSAKPRSRSTKKLPLSSVTTGRSPATVKAKSKRSGPSSKTASLVSLTAIESDLLDSARMQWQFGDWESLIHIDEAGIATHPQRAMLALLIGTAHQQLNDGTTARHYVALAIQWGCERRLLARLLIAGAYNTLARVAALRGEHSKVLHHFRSAIDGAGGDAQLACQARSVREVARLGLYSEAGNLIAQQLQASQWAPSTPPDVLMLGSELADAPTRMRAMAARCLATEDVHAAIDSTLKALAAEERFYLHLALADDFKARGDSITALHFLGQARACVGRDDSAQMAELSKRMIASGRSEEAFDLLVSQAVGGLDLSPSEKEALQKPYATLRDAVEKQKQHGHALLLDYLIANPDSVAREGRMPVLVEIGSTREDLPGQGSTRKIAEHCAHSGIHFITVDMDPHNTESAAGMFQRMGLPFEAVARKGEDFLRDYQGNLDYVFLDAYDFDHGKHSELRQSRYIKFLGKAIDETECHLMHLDCAKSVHAKLSPSGVVCIDDTWLSEDGAWAAKGTLAVPYLLENGFELMEARNRAVLMRRRVGSD